jgi:hypothetical protein
MRHSAVVAFLLVALAPSVGAAQETRSLRFAWPEGSAAQVSVSSSSSVSMMGQTTSVDGELTYRLRTEPEGDGLVVRYSDYVFDGEEMEALIGSENPEELSRVLSSTQADIRIGSDGRFLGLADYEDMRASMEAVLAPHRESLAAEGMAGILDDFVEATLSEEAMTDAAELQWNQMVGFWADRTLTVGEPGRVPSEMVFPILTTTPVTLETELRLVGSTECPAGSGATRCVELASSAAPDGEELRNLMDIFMAEMAEQAGGMGVELGVTAMDLRLESTLIVDEATLRPLRIETTSNTALEMDAMGMPQTMANEQTVVTTFDWAS